MSLESIATTMVENYDLFRYSVNATLHGFLRYWDPKNQTLVEEQTAFVDNGFLCDVRRIVRDLKESEKWIEPRVTFPDLPHYEKENLWQALVRNQSLLKEYFKENLNGELQKNLTDLLDDVPLIVESANRFIDLLDPENLKIWIDKEGHKCTIPFFLRQYDVDRKIYRTKPRKSYRPLLLRLNVQGDVEDLYLNRLEQGDEILSNRLKGLFEDISSGDLLGQERIGMLEFLLEKGAEGIVKEFGVDAYDLLAAIYGEKVLPQSKRHMLHPAVVREYLGVCRRRRQNVNLDWQGDFLNALEGINFKPSLYDQSEVVQRILQNRFRRLYLQRVYKGENVLQELKKDLTGTDEKLRKKLLKDAIEHFELMQEIAQFPEIRKSLGVVKIE